MSRYTILAAAAVGVLTLAAVFTQTRIDAARALVKDELLYLPNEKLLNHFTGGMDSIIADLIWLRCIQYTAAELKGERGFTWLNHMLATCVRLDPYFKDVYRYGGIFLAALRADDDASLRLLEQGCVLHPDAWELPYEMAMVYLLNRKDQPGSRDRARRYLTLSADTGNAPAFVADLVDKLRDTSDLGDTAIEREMWAKLAHSDDQLLRDMAQRELIELDLRDACRALTEMAAAYTKQSGTKIDSLEQLLAAGIIKWLPQDPLGGTFFIDADGVVRSTTILDNELLRRKNIIQTAIDNYREGKGVWPPNLEAVVGPGFLGQLPAHPYPGRVWVYDPGNGRVE